MIPALAAAHAPDVTISIGVGSAPADNFIGAGECRLFVPDVAGYLVRDGASITVWPAPNADDAAVRLYLLGSVFGALLHQRGQVILHGSAVETAHGAMIFVGRSGIGKSTTAAAFSRRGHRVLADDVCTLTSVDAVTHVPPGLAHVKLWEDATQRLSLQDAPARRIRPDMNKFGLLLNERHDLHTVPLHTVHILTAADVEQPALRPLNSVEKARALMHNIYRPAYVERMGCSAEVFTKIAGLTRRVRVVHVARPNDRYALDELLDHLEAHWSAA